MPQRLGYRRGRQGLWHPWPGPPELGATRVAIVLDPRHRWRARALPWPSIRGTGDSRRPLGIGALFVLFADDLVADGTDEPERRRGRDAPPGAGRSRPLHHHSRVVVSGRRLGVSSARAGLFSVDGFYALHPGARAWPGHLSCQKVGCATLSDGCNGSLASRELAALVHARDRRFFRPNGSQASSAT